MFHSIKKHVKQNTKNKSQHKMKQRKLDFIRTRNVNVIILIINKFHQFAEFQFFECFKVPKLILNYLVDEMALFPMLRNHHFGRWYNRLGEKFLDYI